MENHPIPQDITGFQFKLIGDMTVKQFIYIAGGVIIGWVFYILPLPFLIKIPLAIISAVIGVGLAFVPIEGRPMDVMIANFFKAVFSPTQYVYQKEGANLWADGNPNQMSGEEQFRKFLKKQSIEKNNLDKKESVFFQNVNTFYATPQGNLQPSELPSHYYATQAPGQQPIQGPLTSRKAEHIAEADNQNLIQNAAVLEKELAKAKAVEQKQSGVDPKAYLETHQKVLELQQQMSEMLTQKKDLENKLVELQKSMASSNSPVFKASVATESDNKETKNVRSIPHSMAKSAGLPSAPEFPNLLTGIIKDPRGNPLGNILVEVKDEEDNAVRAFKTNALGHFASATPLNNGKYTVIFEDPKGQHKFDSVAFEANGEIILPIEIISVDQREELRRSLFN